MLYTIDINRTSYMFSSYGDTPQEAIQNIKSELEGYFKAEIKEIQLVPNIKIADLIVRDTDDNVRYYRAKYYVRK